MTWIHYERSKILYLLQSLECFKIGLFSFVCMLLTVELLHGREGSFLSSASLVFSSVLIDFCKWLLQSVWYTKGVANRIPTDDLEKGEFCPAFQQNVDMLTLSLVYYLTWKFFTENLPWFVKEAYWQLLIWEPGTILGGKILCRACFQLCVNEVMYGM